MTMSFVKVAGSVPICDLCLSGTDRIIFCCCFFVILFCPCECRSECCCSCHVGLKPIAFAEQLKLRIVCLDVNVVPILL